MYKFIRDHIIIFLYCLIPGFLFTDFSIKYIIPLVFLGKEFETRGLPIKIILFISITFLFSIINFLIFYYSRYLKWVVWIGIGLIGTILLGLHLRLIFFPYQMEYREGAVILTTQAFLRGINPWVLENNPIYINVYGFVYNLVVLPFAWLLGNQLWVHRMVSFFATFAQIGLISTVLQKMGVIRQQVILAGLFIWVGQYYSTSSLSRPDTLGQLFFLLTLFLPLIYNYTPRSLIFSSLFGLLGFYTKPYFILGIPVISLYIFLFISRRKSLYYALGTILVLVLSAIIVNKIFEAYFLNTIFSHIADTQNNYQWLLIQNIKFARDYWAFILIGFIVVLRAIMIALRNWGKTNIYFTFPKLIKQISSSRPDLNLLMLAISCFIVYFSMGRHPGSLMVYYYQLLTPFLVILVFSYIQNFPRVSNIAVFLLTINLVTYSYGILMPELKPYNLNSWQKLDVYLNNNYTNPGVNLSMLNSPVLVTPMIQKNIAIINSGQSQYYFPIPKIKSYFYPNLDHISFIGEQYTSTLQQNIRDQSYKVVFADKYLKSQDLENNYRTIDVVNINLAHTHQTWRIKVMVPKIDINK